MADIIKQFFAVTLTSVYQVEMDESDNAFAKKIALKGTSSIALGCRIQGGTRIAIGDRLIAYIPERYGEQSPLTAVERRIELVNTRYWGGGSSSIVALFFDQEAALDCHSQPDLQPRDPRWVSTTREVVAKIGPDHPAFYICCDPDLTLFPPSSPSKTSVGQPKAI